MPQRRLPGRQPGHLSRWLEVDEVTADEREQARVLQSVADLDPGSSHTLAPVAGSTRDRDRGAVVRPDPQLDTTDGGERLEPPSRDEHERSGREAATASFGCDNVANLDSPLGVKIEVDNAKRLFAGWFDDGQICSLTFGPADASSLDGQTLIVRPLVTFP